MKQTHKQQSFIKKVGNYSLLKVIGKGSFATVYLGSNQTGDQFAIKEMEKPSIQNDDGRLELFKREIEILQSVDHMNIIKLYNKIEIQNYIYLIFEFCGLGDLEKYIKQQQGSKLQEPQIKTIFVQIVDSLRELQKLNIVHRDLKLANILISNDFVIKIADFGFARTIQSQNSLLESYCGTPLTMAPEILRNDQKYSSKCDLWSLGVILYQMAFGIPPFKPKAGGNINDLLIVIETQDLAFPGNVIISNQLQTLLKQLLQRDPTKRIGIDEVVKSDWIKNEFRDKNNRLEQSQMILKNIVQKPVEKQEKQEDVRPQPNKVSEDQKEAFFDCQQGDDLVQADQIAEAIYQKITALKEQTNKLEHFVKTCKLPKIESLENNIKALKQLNIILQLKSEPDSQGGKVEVFNVHLQKKVDSKPIMLDKVLFQICLDIYQQQIEMEVNQQQQCLQILKDICYFINIEQGLISNELIIQSKQQLKIKESQLQDTIQEKLERDHRILNQSNDKGILIQQNFRVCNDDWNLLQNLILDRDKLLEIYRV